KINRRSASAHELIEVDRDLADRKTVRHDDATAVLRAEDGVAERKRLDSADLGSRRTADLQQIAEPERTIDQNGDAGDEIAERALRREAENDRGDAGAREHRRAERVQRRNEMGIRGKD